MKQIKLTFTKRNVSAIAELNEELAPETCTAVLESLPHKGKAFHAKWSGNEIWTSFRVKNLNAKENETILPSPGEVFLFRVPGAEKTDPFHLAIFYGRAACSGPTGSHAGTHFATITKGFNEFKKACNALYSEGAEEIAVEEIG